MQRSDMYHHELDVYHARGSHAALCPRPLCPRVFSVPFLFLSLAVVTVAWFVDSRCATPVPDNRITDLRMAFLVLLCTAFYMLLEAPSALSATGPF